MDTTTTTRPRPAEASIRARHEGARRYREARAPWTRSARILEAAGRLADDAGRLRRADLMRAMGADSDGERRTIDGLIYALRKRGDFPFTFVRAGGVPDRLAELGRLLDAMTPDERSAAADLVRARTT